ncbi:acyltransferase [Hymenobacter oligotrophus]|uniref:Acyltransferase n=1 Tax=Hymenobacter oligotrophus TaxID=2319843 RepID=A0A3B7R8Z5_9BACT|nr:acyltransferase [Hymenobacter oligotrophus]AYA37329.1 acyltransferase [Hymenobacter oligotrophus]
MQVQEPVLSEAIATPTARPAKPYFGALTGVRAVAAYMVFVHHFNPFKGATSAAGQFFERLCEELHIGVTLFFVLSGLLICVRYMDHVELSGRWALRYLRNRVARIYPLYLLLTLLTFAAFALRPELDNLEQWKWYAARDKLAVIISNITFLRGFFDDLKFSGIAQGWSLTVEECFYFTAPFLLLGLTRSRGLIWLYPPVLVGLGLLLVQVLAPRQLLGLFDSNEFMFIYTFFGRSTEFVVGMALGLLVKRRTRPTQPGWLWTGTGLVWIFGCLLVLISLHSETLGGGFGSPWRIVVNNAVLPLGIASLFYGLIYERSAMQAVLSTPLFDTLGKSSYAFYLVHMSVFSVALDIWISNNVGLKFVLLNLLAYGLYRAVEKPLHRIIAGRA